MLLEASSLIGGTASWSGGAAWIPLNARMREAGLPDSREAAATYMSLCAGGKADPALYATFLDEAAAVAGISTARVGMGWVEVEHDGSVTVERIAEALEVIGCALVPASRRQLRVL